jgi:hypothetical protein
MVAKSQATIVRATPFDTTCRPEFKVLVFRRFGLAIELAMAPGPVDAPGRVVS